jgi:hypothetical protein
MIQNILKVGFASLSFLLFSIACSKYVDFTEAVGGNVYVVGYEGPYYNNYKSIFWHDAKFTTMSENSSYPASIFVNEYDVYVAGYKTEDSSTYAMLWKNGVPTKLSAPGRRVFANSVFVSGSDVYVAGVEEGIYSKIKLWKNGIATTLSDSSFNNSGNPVSLFVSGNDVYVGGQLKINQDFKGIVWKNGTPTNLVDSTTNVKSIFAVGQDVYVAGESYDSNTGKKNIKVCKNGSCTIVPNTKDANLKAMFVVGSDIYLVGNRTDKEKQIAALWKNGDLTNLTNGGNTASADAIYVSGGIVYVGGFECPSPNCSIPKIWKNSIAYELSNGAGVSGVSSIFVK